MHKMPITTATCYSKKKNDFNRPSTFAVLLDVFQDVFIHKLPQGDFELYTSSWMFIGCKIIMF